MNLASTTAPISDPSPTPARRTESEIRAWLVGEIARAIKEPPDAVDSSAALLSLGVDSLTGIEMTGRLSQWLERDVPATMMWEYDSIDAIADALAESDVAVAPPLPSEIIELCQGSRRPIFFFPAPRDNPMGFAPTAARLEDVPAYALRHLDQAADDSPPPTIEQMATLALLAIRQVQAKGPYQLAGYCFGGLAAYEVACQLAAQGETVSMLCILDAFAPQALIPKPAIQRLANHARLLAAGPNRAEQIRTAAAKRQQKIAKMFGLARHGRPDPQKDAVADLIARSEYAAHIYRPRPYPGSALVLRPQTRVGVFGFYKEHPTNGWGPLASAGANVFEVPGTHATMLSAANAATLAEKLLPFLDSAE